MNVPLDFACEIIRKIAAVSFVLQSIEYLWIRDTFNDKGIWRLPAIAPDYDFFPRPFKSILNVALRYDNFIKILLLRLLLSALLFFSGNLYFVITLLVISILTAIRWRGTFNGGSDYMSVIVLISLGISQLSSHGDYQLAGVYYVCFHAASSYFFAGLVKIKSPDWRNGNALRSFITATIYSEGALVRNIANNRLLGKIISMVVISWELLFPLSLLHLHTAVVFLSLGVLFHLCNAYIIGLNRFFFIWLATYPALLYVAQ